MLNIWTKPSGYTFTNSGQPFQEQVSLNVALPVSSTTGITFTIISGSLPGGVSIIGSSLVGNPYIVNSATTYTFCIRASSSNGIADRTFNMIVNGANPPEFVTPAGELPVGPRQQLYALDGTYVNYQIEAFDLNTSIGGSLKYFIATGDGSLPPGLTLSNDGVISGYIKPQEILTPAAGTGEFDQADFDIGAYDFALIPTDGFDSYQFDDVFFDYNLPSVLPKSLNANYQFRVTATDGINYAQRIFNIFVVGDDQFRADSTSTNRFSDGFTADSTFLRTPVWLSNTSLGIFRANNYLTVPVLLYDNTDIIFRLETTNCEVYAVSKQILISDNALNSYFVTVTNLSSVPVIGQYFTLDNYLNGATSQTYQISAVNQVTAPITGTLTNGSKIITGINYAFINELTIGATIDGGGIPVNSTIVQIAVNSNVSPNTITVTMNNNATVSTTASINVGIAGYYRLTITTPLAIAIPNFTAFYIGSLSQLPKGTQFDVETGEIYGRVPYQPAITETYAFTITATRFSANIVDQVINHKTFNITILGSINRQITWTSPSNLGTIPANYVSTLRVSATTNIPNDTLLYTLTGGSLPPGLTLTLDGEIVGIPNQYYNSTTGQLGLTTFDGGLTTFDFKETTSDLTYNFTVTVSDQYEYSALPQTFTITLSAPNSVPYSNITCQPFLAPAQRSVWKAFINNPTIFIPSDIYRINDPNFGIQSNLNMLVYAGIQTEVAGAYVGAIGLGFKRKQFKFGSLKTAIATDPITNETVYEVVYVQMIDPRESNGNHLPLNFKTTSLEPNVITVDESIINAKPLYNITVDSKGYLVSNPNTDEYYPNSITNWQTRLSGVGLTERNYLPLWMRSIPLGQKAQLGYVLCVPLCFCKPGTSNDILLNIEHSGFNFNTIDYTVDRFIISAVTGYASDKYLVFRNDRITV